MAPSFDPTRQTNDPASVDDEPRFSRQPTAVDDISKEDAAKPEILSAIPEKKSPEVHVEEVEDDEVMPDVALPTEILPEAPILGGKLKDSFLNFWWQEFIACAAMVLSIVGISITLAVHNGQPLPKWPIKLTLNTVISILVVILKATMLAILTSGLGQQKWLWFKKVRPLAHYGVYDKAGQGPNYATHLCYVLRGRQFIACLGAAIIIVTQVLDPFTQQVIHFRSHTAPSKLANATLPRTTVYDIVGYHVGAGLSTIDNPMEGAIMAGFYTPNSDSYNISVSGCSTGNCNFTTPYTTIEMSSFCTVMTDSIQGTCINDTSSDISAGCNYTLPSNNTLQTGQDILDWIIGSEYTSTYPAGTMAGREFIWNPASSEAISGIGNSTCEGAACGVLAADCFFYPSIATYNATVANGELTETLLSRVALPSSTDGGYCWSSFRKDCLTNQEKITLAGQGLDVNNDTSDYIPFCGTYTENYDPTLINPVCYYDFAEASFFSFQYYFEFSGFLNGSLQGFSPVGVTGPTDLSFLWTADTMTLDSINATFASMANAITARMRVAGNATYSSPASGNIMVTQTVVHVVWPWLALPLSMVMLTLIFIFVTMVQTTTKGHKPIGKVFGLGLLLTGVAGQVTDQLPDMKYVHQVWTQAKDVKEAHEESIKKAHAAHVQFKETEDGWRLIKV